MVKMKATVCTLWWQRSQIHRDFSLIYVANKCTFASLNEDGTCECFWKNIIIPRKRSPKRLEESVGATKAPSAPLFKLWSLIFYQAAQLVKQTKEHLHTIATLFDLLWQCDRYFTVDVKDGPKRGTFVLAVTSFQSLSVSVNSQQWEL